MRQRKAEVVVSAAAAVVEVEIVELGNLRKEGPTLVGCGSWRAIVGQR